MIEYVAVLVASLFIFGFGFLCGSIRSDNKYRIIEFELHSDIKEKQELKSKINKLENNNDKLEKENRSLLNILKEAGFSKTVKYDPFLHRYEQCWRMTDKKGEE